MARIQATCSAKLATATALHSLFYILSHKLLFYNNRRLKAAGVLRPLLLPFATTDHFPFTRQSQTWNHVKTSNRYFFLSPHSWAAWCNVEGASMQNINSAKRKIWNYAIPVSDEFESLHRVYCTIFNLTILISSRLLPIESLLLCYLVVIGSDAAVMQVVEGIVRGKNIKL